MKRLPDGLYRAVERLYFDQRAIRRREQNAAVEREDRALRESADRMRAAHASGQCSPRCPYRHDPAAPAGAA